MLNLELAPFPHAALLPPHPFSHVSADSLLSFHIVHLFLFTSGFFLIFIPLTFSAPFPMFACPPNLLPYHTYKTLQSRRADSSCSSLQKHLHGKPLQCKKVSSHTLLQRGTTSCFPPRKGRNLKSCPRIALLRSWGKAYSGAVWGLGCHQRVVCAWSTLAVRGVLLPGSC